MNLRKFILDALRKKFEGVDEKVLNRIARTAAKTVKTEEEATQFVEDYTIQQVIDSYTDSRVNEARETAVQSYEKKYGLKDGKKAGEGDGGTEDPDNGDKNKPGEDKNKGGKGEGNEDGKGDDMPAWAKAVLDGQKALNERLDKIESGKTADTRKSKLAEILKDAPDKVKARYEKAFARMSFKDDEDFEDWLENDVTPDVEDSSASEEQGKGMVSGPKGGSKGGKEDYKPSQALQDRVKRNETETAPSAIMGLQVSK